MYEIYEGIKVELNRTTPSSVKAYQQALQEQGVESVNNVSTFVKEELVKQVQDGETTESSIREIVSKGLRNSGIASFDLFYNQEFIYKWLPVIFKITPEQIEKTKIDFDNKFSVDEFSKGYTDFFVRLRNPLIG